MHRCVFLDRDNTLIRNDGDLGDPERVELIQGAASAVASLRGLGYRVVVITNQGGVARGRYKEADVEAVHARLNDLIAHYANGARIDAFYYCPYHPEGNLKQYRKDHPDRKPQPGMLLRAAEDLSLDLIQSWTVGDQVRDVQAGAAAGTRTILLRPDAERLAHVDPHDLQGLDPELAQAVSTPPRRVPDFFAHDLVEAVRIIAQQRKPEATADPKLAGKFHGRKWDAAAIAELQRTGRPPKPADASEQEDAEAPTQ
ncbi:MAG: D-glycero-alpha-D-manno-heptose-1,7-bisphosphate 7-phosphatase, partial [Phycisphaeraceae bacterium]